MPSPKYSIIVPAFNGMPYLQDCIESVIRQEYDDYELIVSDDHSTDGSAEFVRGLHHPRIVRLHTNQHLSMTEHWEWALSHASGEWQMFLGQDDGVQRYFFQCADRLTSYAKGVGIRAIASRRAFYCWPGCEELSGLRVFFFAENRFRVKRTFPAALKALFVGPYFELPQMYTTSLFHRDLLDAARSRQGGTVFCCHPQDANLAAIACSLEKRYLLSDIPFGWVGTSLKSAGLAVSVAVAGSETAKTLVGATSKLRHDYVGRVEKSRFRYNERAGSFQFADPCVYFWQALLETGPLRSRFLQHALTSRFLTLPLLAASWLRMGIEKPNTHRVRMFHDILRLNRLRMIPVAVVGYVFLAVTLTARFLHRGFRRLSKTMLPRLSPEAVRFSVYSNDAGYASLTEAGIRVHDVVKQKAWL